MRCSHHLLDALGLRRICIRLNHADKLVIRPHRKIKYRTI